MIRFVQGNMFDEKYDVLVNTVNCVGVMGKGVALEFKKRYPDMFKNYRFACSRHEIHPGILHVWRGPSVTIINFPTKIHWRDPSQYEYIAKGLDALWNWMCLECDKGTTVAIPPLGCGNGGLDWARVRSMIEEALRETHCDITVFEPVPAKAVQHG